MKVMIHILMVDDEPDAAPLFRQRFRREIRKGLIDLRIAQSGREALAIMEDYHRESPLVILSDINMPEMDGMELLGRLKGLYPEPRIFMVSAYFGGSDYEEKALSAGADGVFPKPINFEELKQRIYALGE